jgi:hypothetical protein
MGGSHTLCLFLLGLSISICSTIAAEANAEERSTCRNVIINLINDDKTMESEYLWKGRIHGLKDNIPLANTTPALNREGAKIPYLQGSTHCFAL